MVLSHKSDADFDFLLLQEMLCSTWATCEQQNLFWLRCNQRSIRADLYQDAVTSARNGTRRGADAGQRIVLPASFTGGPRQMQQLYQVIAQHPLTADVVLSFDFSNHCRHLL